MQIVVLAAAVALLLTWAAVGIRMLLLARRTGGVPELTLGLGLLLLAAIGYPMTVIAQAPGMGPEARYLVGGIGTSIADAGVFCLFLFTWRVFRPDARWAALVVLGVVALVTLHVCGWLDSSRGATSQAELLDQSLVWSMLQLGLVVTCFGWAGAESLHQWSLARRRQRLGLADPVVVNRFLLWGAMGAVSAGVALFDVLLVLVGGPTATAVLYLASSLSGMADAVLLTLAFFPPPAYTRWVAGRAAASA